MCGIEDSMALLSGVAAVKSMVMRKCKVYARGSVGEAVSGSVGLEG
jgi:hypothetical protein